MLMLNWSNFNLCAFSLPAPHALGELPANVHKAHPFFSFKALLKALLCWGDQNTLDNR